MRMNGKRLTIDPLRIASHWMWYLGSEIHEHRIMRKKIWPIELNWLDFYRLQIQINLKICMALTRGPSLYLLFFSSSISHLKKTEWMMEKSVSLSIVSSSIFLKLTEIFGEGEWGVCWVEEEMNEQKGKQEMRVREKVSRSKWIKAEREAKLFCFFILFILCAFFFYWFHRHLELVQHTQN